MKNNNSIITGDISIDDRGMVRYVNEFRFTKVRRFYHIENFSRNTIRAFHGHKYEEKYVYVATGSILVCLVKIKNYKKPNKKSAVVRHVLSSNKPSILHIPKGYANGFKALVDNTNVLFFSNKNIAESKNDDFRYPYDYWGESIWKTVNR